MPKTILITGATGTVGSQVVQQLAAGHAAVRVLVRSQGKADAFLDTGMTAFVGDFEKPETLAPALDGADAMFLLSAPDPRQVELESNAIDAAKRAGVRHVVKLSAIGAGLDATFSFGRLHGEIEQRLEASGLPYTHLRSNGFLQNLLGSAETVKGQGALFGPLGDARVSFVDARDVAAVAAAVLTGDGHDGKAYVITGPEAITFAEIAQKIGAASGREVKYVEVLFEAAREAMLGQGIPEWQVDGIIELSRFYVAGNAAMVTDVVREVAGKEPITVDQFARDHADAFGAR
jgi:uncharacterized protein YbjT (DUF2867 family)